MRIAILEGRWNEMLGDGWDDLARLGEIVGVHTHCTREEALARAGQAEILVTGSIRWDAEMFDAAPCARLLVLTGTGYDKIDLAEARRRGVTVCNVPDYASDAVAQTALALVLELANRAGAFDADVRGGAWDATREVCCAHPVFELAGKTMGIVGMGGIGRAAARMARGFGMDVVFWNRTPRPALEGDGVRQVDLDELFARSDVVSLHCAATPETRHIVDARALGLMKPTALLVNTARGSLVDEAALVRALESGSIAGAGLDVLEVEPPTPDNPLLRLPNVVLTPHVGWMAREALGRLHAQIVANVAAYLAGEPVNVVGTQP